MPTSSEEVKPPNPKDFPDRPRLLICIPGSEYSWQWLFHFVNLLPYLYSNFLVNINFSSGCNIYEVRNGCAAGFHDAADKGAAPEYVLWIDSDNCVSVESFRRLKAALDNVPEAGAVGGWYTYFGKDGKLDIAGGSYEFGHPTIERIKELKDDELMELDYIGFGFLLMRGKVLTDLGRNPFSPVALEQTLCGFEIDDVAFCRAARGKGWKFFLHPKVNAPHLKLLTVPIIQPPVQVE